MPEECKYESVKNYNIEIKVVSSKCDIMPARGVIMLEGPKVNYEISGPICLTAINAIYPWIMLSRFDVKTDALDYDLENNCYHTTCPCGIVEFEIRNIK